MAETDPLSAAVAEVRARELAATPGPWWFDEDDLVWRLHGVHAVLPTGLAWLPDQVINHQILKAPKQGTPYAEYWPNEADAAFIVHARTDVPRLLAAVEAALEVARVQDVLASAMTDPLRDELHPDMPQAVRAHQDGQAFAQREAAASLRAAVLAALTGKEPS